MREGANRGTRRWLKPLLIALVLFHSAHVSAARETLLFDIEGQSRSVLLFVPDAASVEPGSLEPRSLVVVFHGLGDDSRPFANAVQLHREWPDAIIAYPRGETRESSRRGWQYLAGELGDRDLKLVDRLLEETAKRYGTRPESTHAAGFSNGGQFVFVLLEERPDAFASFAAIGATRPNLAGESTPKPFMYLLGRSDNLVSRDDWAKTIEALTRHNRTRGPLADYLGCCKLHAPGEGGAPLVFGLYNAGHVWPFRGNDWLMAFFTHDWGD